MLENECKDLIPPPPPLFIRSLNGTYFISVLAKWKGYWFYFTYLLCMTLNIGDISSFILYMTLNFLIIYYTKITNLRVDSDSIFKFKKMQLNF